MLRNIYKQSGVGDLEDYAYILDHLPQGLPDERRFKREPIAFGLGENEFKILELIPKENIILEIGTKVYIGKDMDKRDKVLHVKRRVRYEDITNTAQNELSYVISEIVKNNEERFVKFFNEAQAISTRFHMLELLPGLGKKTMWSIIDERKKAQFESFKDIGERVHSLHQCERLICKRIELELSDPTQKYHLFVTK
jgi:putative nucleotide binding protein